MSVTTRHARAVTPPVRSHSAAQRRIGDTVAIPGDYQHRARTHGFVVQRFWHAEKERMIRKYSVPRPGERVLDVGCGSGVVSDALASMGAVVTGVDANPDAIAYASNTFRRENLDFRLGLVENLDFPPASMDRVYCFELIEHIYEGQAHDLFRLLRMLARPGGVLTVTTPNYRGLWPAVEFTLDRLKLVPTLADAQHVTHYSSGRLRSLLHETGWEIERLTTFSTLAPFASLLSWRFGEYVAVFEDRLRLPFGNILFAVARNGGP